MLDSVRHFFNKDEVKQLLDTMALHKLNMFHWHLDDDSGWRLEILKWPLLTQVSAWRTDIMWDINPRSSTAWREDGLYGGFYTQAEAREIVEYAAQRHITVVPEIEMPGHSSSALAAYPQFACGYTNDCPTCYNGPYSLNVTSYVGGVFCIARPETMSFLQDVLTEVMDVFPGPYIHIGGDEVNFTNWRRHSLDQALTNSLGTSGHASVPGPFRAADRELDQEPGPHHDGLERDPERGAGDQFNADGLAERRRAAALSRRPPTGNTRSCAPAPSFISTNMKPDWTATARVCSGPMSRPGSPGLCC